MIEAVVFDLDGTLVQTEKLKALSYARAAVELCPDTLEEDEVIEAFREVVGRSRRYVAKTLVQRFGLGEKAMIRAPEFGVTRPWQAYVQLRLIIYGGMIAEPQVIRQNQWPHNIALLQESHRAGCKIGLATMSSCQQANRVLEALGLTSTFDFIATRDDVESGKPDPEIYNLVASELAVSPADCLVIEDSVSGVQAAISAGMRVLAVSTPFTQASLHKADLLPDALIIDDPEEVVKAVASIMKINNGVTL